MWRDKKFSQRKVINTAVAHLLWLQSIIKFLFAFRGSPHERLPASTKFLTALFDFVRGIMIAVDQILTGSKHRVDSKLMIGQLIFKGLKHNSANNRKR